MINFWEYEKPRPLWTLTKLVGHRYLVSGIYGSRFIYTRLYRIFLGLGRISQRRRCCNLELNWGAFHWDVPCYNDRAQLTQNHFSACIYEFVTLIMKSEHFKTLPVYTVLYAQPQALESCTRAVWQTVYHTIRDTIQPFRVLWLWAWLLALRYDYVGSVRVKEIRLESITHHSWKGMQWQIDFYKEGRKKTTNNTSVATSDTVRLMPVSRRNSLVGDNREATRVTVCA